MLNQALHLEAMKYFEIFLKNKQIAEQYKKLKIHILVANNLEREI